MSNVERLRRRTYAVERKFGKFVFQFNVSAASASAAIMDVDQWIDDTLLAAVAARGSGMRLDQPQGQ